MDATKVGNRIAARRRAMGLTGEGLSEIIGVTPQAVSKWENGRSLPDTAILPALAKALGTSIDFLLLCEGIEALWAYWTDGTAREDAPSIFDGVREADFDLPARRKAGEGGAWLLCAAYRLRGETRYVCAPRGGRLRGAESFVAPQTGMRIVRAYYGTDARFLDVMSKIAHYEFFRYARIRVNHETFPSDPAAKETEYLTVAYANERGLHVVSCPEEGVLDYVNARCALARGEANERWVDGVMPLHARADMACTWGGAMTAALCAMGHMIAYETVMGVSGACFRLAFTDVWDFSANDALVAFDYSSILLRALGYENVFAARVPKSEREREKAAIVRDIDEGKCVVAINLRVAAEWGVIAGYRDGGDTLLCRTYFDDPADDPGDASGYRPAENWPFLLQHFGNRAQPLSEDDALRASLRALVESFEAKQKCADDYRQGEDAYNAWIDALGKEESWTGEAGGVKRRLCVNDTHLENLIDARRAAARFLSAYPGETAEIAAEYGGIADALAAFRAAHAFDWDAFEDKPGVRAAQERMAETELLAQTRDRERGIAERVKTMLSRGEFACRK